MQIAGNGYKLLQGSRNLQEEIIVSCKARADCRKLATLLNLFLQFAGPLQLCEIPHCNS